MKQQKGQTSGAHYAKYEKITYDFLELRFRIGTNPMISLSNAEKCSIPVSIMPLIGLMPKSRFLKSALAVEAP